VKAKLNFHIVKDPKDGEERNAEQEGHEKTVGIVTSSNLHTNNGNVLEDYHDNNYFIVEYSNIQMH
jgi:hypothetical protein